MITSNFKSGFFPLLISFLAFLSVFGLSPPRPLPLPNPDIPADLSPALTNGRVDVHGWLWLPWDRSETDAIDAPILGWFYHHTPECFVHSPHDFEIMTAGSLILQNTSQVVPILPFPPKADLVGTEYVFTPPEFSLDLLIKSELTTYEGRFTNGSFDTPQRYLLSQATFSLMDLTTVHYLTEIADDAFLTLPYLSYPRDALQLQNPAKASLLHFYFLHLLEVSPDFDQIVHVTIDPTTCSFVPGDSLGDLVASGATFVIPSSINDVYHRLHTASPTHTVQLMTLNTQKAASHSECKITVLEEIHCVVVPDSFANCPAPSTQFEVENLMKKREKRP